jgi:hypothetical protein
MADYQIVGVKAPLKPMVFELSIDLPPPPLILLLNPNNFEIKMMPKQTENRTRWVDRRESGYIIETHHDELDVLTASGRSAQFYNAGGLTSENKQQSLGWENIQKLIAVYRNNGMNFNRTPNNKSQSLITSVGRALIIYDGEIYSGSFHSLNINESQEKQFSLDFDFEFKVHERFSQTSVSDIMMNNGRTNI